MNLQERFCPNCGNKTQINVEKEVNYCVCCGYKIILARGQDKRVDNRESAREEKTSQKEINITEKLEEVDFYYQMSRKKKEALYRDKDPLYYLKGQDLLVDMTEKWPGDYRVWWELAKPLDYQYEEEVKDINSVYFFNKEYFDKALAYAPLPVKKEIITKYEEYEEIKKRIRIDYEDEVKRRQEEEKRKEEERIREEKRIQEEEKRKEEERIREEKRKEQERIREEKRIQEEEKRKERKRIQEEEKRRREEEEKEKQEERRRKIECEKQKKEQERQRLIAEQQAKEIQQKIFQNSLPLWKELSEKKYTIIDDTYFVLRDQEGKCYTGVLKVISNVLYLMSFRIEEEKQVFYREQTLTVKFNNKGIIVKYDGKPVKIKSKQYNGESVLNVMIKQDGKMMINNMNLEHDPEYVQSLIKESRKALLSFSKIFN